jgi:peptide/nickel transport system substrate-binding protein
MAHIVFSSRMGRSLMLLPMLLIALHLQPQTASRGVVWAIGYDPATLDPAKVDDQASELVRYLTGGVLLRINRRTSEVEPSLATAWSVSADGRTVVFHLRQGLLFSDGSPLDAADVAWSVQRVLTPAIAAPVAEEFLTPREVTVEAPDAVTVVVHLPRRLVEIGRIFDEIAIEPRNRPSEGRVTAGPYRVVEYRRSQFIRLERNVHYWKHDAAGASLPYLPSIRLDVVANAEQEQVRFTRSQYQFLNTVSPDYFNLLARTMPQAAHDLGPSLNTEQLWFNQSPNSPLAAYERQWFQSTTFRVAISRAIHRADLARLAYASHATPAYGFISPANHAWYNSALEAPHEDLAAAKAMLAKAGFHRVESGARVTLYDASNHAVRFSILTNAGNIPRQKMATLIQQDLAALGIEVTVVTLDFPALIERLMHTQDYEACILGLANVDPDPNSMMNLWLSSSPNHQWNPSEKVPATPWEAAVDSAMRVQARARNLSERVRAVDQVQQIIADQQPFIYLVYPNVLYGVSPALAGVEPSVLQPGTIWNIENIHWAKGKP